MRCLRKENQGGMAMKRRHFIVASLAALSAVALKIRMAGRLLLYPGRIVPLNEEALKKSAKWKG